MAQDEYIVRTITYEDFNTVCRLCMKEGKLLSSINGTLVEDLDLQFLIEDTISLEMISNDEMPQNICDNCISCLYSFYLFKKSCHNNFLAFNSLCSNVNTLQFEGLDKEAGIFLLKVENNVDFQEGNSDEIKLLVDGDQIKQNPKRDLESDETENTNTEKLQSKFDPPKRKYGCRTCGSSFKTIQEASIHKKQKRHAEFASVVCDLCGGSYIRQKKALHMRSCRDGVTYDCQICSRSFNLRNNLLRHTMSHTGEKPFRCSQCNKCFSQKVSLQAHEKTHKKKDQIQCEYCAKIFFSQPLFDRHILKHKENNTDSTLSSDQRNYVCEICPSMFSTLTALKTHSKLHGEAKFLCYECGKVCGTKALLDSHMRIHTGEKPFACETCSKKFANRGTLDNHRLIHTGERPHKCRYCSMTFRQVPHLKLHERTHTGERPYGCPFCNKRFSFKGNLTVHVRLHTGHRPFKCDICGKEFVHLSAKKLHRANHLKNLSGFVKDEKSEVPPNLILAC